MNSLSILLIDDDVIERMKFKKVCEDLSFSCSIIEAVNGKQALELLTDAKNSFNIIILDLHMPIMSGLELLEVLKSTITFKYIPVVMMTSSKLDNDLIDSYNYGVNAYVLKPVNMEQFIVAIQNIGLFWAVFNRTIEP